MREGAELGAGFTTLVPAWMWWTMVLRVAASQSVVCGAIAGTVFGAVRGGEPVLSARLAGHAHSNFLE